MHPKRTPIVRLALVVSLGSSTLVACREPSEPHTPGPSVPAAASDPTSDQTEAFSWDALIGVRLRSVELHPGGLGEDGPVLQHQYLKLNANGSFEVFHADVLERGTYRLEGLRLIARTRDMEMTGEFDPERGVLTVGGIEFERP